MDNVIWNFAEFIPYLLHDCTHGHCVVLKGIILMSNLHHESWDKDTTPDVSGDTVRPMGRVFPYEVGFLTIKV